MAGEIVGGIAVNLNSGEVFFAVQPRKTGAFELTWALESFLMRLKVDFLTYSCTVCEAVMLCAVFVSLKVCEFPRYPFHRLGLEEQVA